LLLAASGSMAATTEAMERRGSGWGLSADKADKGMESCVSNAKGAEAP
jgi:hypothetical protein